MTDRKRRLKDDSDLESGSDIQQEDFDSEDYEDWWLSCTTSSARISSSNSIADTSGGSSLHNAISDNKDWQIINDVHEDCSPEIRLFVADSGPVYCPNSSNPIDYFDQFFMPSDDSGVNLWHHILAETNKYREMLLKQPTTYPNAVIRQLGVVTLPQLKAFIGVTMNMGLVQMPSCESYWTKSYANLDVPFFASIFRASTYRSLSRVFHVANNDEAQPRCSLNYDPSHKFRSVLDHFNKAWKRNYNLGRTISIDEAIVNLKSRRSSVKYTKMKEQPEWSPKEYNLCDSVTGYCYHTKYHLTSGTYSESGHSYDVCADLMSSLHHKNHHLYVDSHYTSVKLCETFLEQGTYVTGTVEPNCKYLPSFMKEKLQRDEYKVAKKNELMAINWMANKPVLLLSTCSSAAPVEIKNKRGRKIVIPGVVDEYSKHMEGVALSDRLTNCYSAERKTIKRWKEIVFHLIDRTVTNAYLLYKHNPNRSRRTMNHYEFVTKLVLQLVGEYREPYRKAGQPSCSQLAVARLVERHFAETVADGKRKTCAVCSSGALVGKPRTRKVRTFCPDCSVGLCVPNCFRYYHTEHCVMYN